MSRKKMPADFAAYDPAESSKTPGEVGLYKALSRDGNPSLSTVLKVAKALGIRLKMAASPRRATARAA